MPKKKPATGKAKTPKPRAFSPRSSDKPGLAVVQRSDGQIPIVGLGASAGGFEVLQRFLASTSPDSGIAYIVVQHLDPTRVSELPALLARHSKLPVSLVEQGERIRADRVYVIPPDRYVTVEAGFLKLSSPPEPRGLRLPVDTLFYSMAQHSAECGIGVILSGNGSDGSLGLRAIKGNGGLAIVQDPATAEYEGMPRSAIATGVVDYILPVDRMMDAIRSFVDHDYVRNGADQEARIPDHIENILALLHARRNVDFSGYKKGTLVRRINRRMSLRQITRGGDYLKVLRESSDEVNALFNDLLIQVTRFFREPQSWHTLEREVLTRLVDDADKDTPIRVWVPGCATGEEAYSLAMLLIEVREKAQKNVPIQIFASDLDSQALDFARAGVYPESIAADVSPERLHRFFTRGEHRYSVHQHLRDTIVFALQNVITDPPFSRLDLVSCRNLLIYLEASAQRRVLDIFHFALRPGRYLFLGNSETIGPQTDLFQPMSKRVRIYRRLGAIRLDRLRLAVGGGPPTATGPNVGLAQPTPRDGAALAHARELVLQRHTAASALVNRKFEILSLYGPTFKYLSQPTGTLTADILAWVPDGVRTKVRVALQTAVRRNDATTIHGIKLRIEAEKEYRSVSVTVEPIQSPAEADGLLLVIFADDPATTPAAGKPKRKQRPEPEEPLVQQLEYELKVARDDLQTSVEQLESSNEELRATNEEVLSMNEELQSANEELETSKEELQSVNEELTTVNSQLESKISELQEISDDISNLLTSTELPVLFLDRQFLIRRYTPAMVRLFRLIPTDLGRPIQDIAHLANDTSLLDDAKRVLERLVPIEEDLETHDGHAYLRRVLPYRTDDNRIQGVVVTYTDVSHRVEGDRAVKEARDFSQSIVETMSEPLLVLDDGLVVRGANPSFCTTYRANPGEVIGVRISEVADGEWNIPRLRRMLADMLQDGTDKGEMQVRQEFRMLGNRVINVNARLLDREGRKLIILGLDDVTKEMDFQNSRNEILRRLVNWEEKERHRLALELHDEAGQHVTAFLLGLAALKATHKDPGSAAVIDQLQNLADELARRLHGLSLQLRPTALDDHGLERALQSYIEDLTHRNHFQIDFQATGTSGRVPSHIETVLYRVAQEGLTNVMKHADASKVSVILDRRKDEIKLVIEDDGRGFLPAQVAEDGNRLGLRGMRERVNLVGGELNVESTPGKGATIYVRVPLNDNNQSGVEV